MSSEEKVNRIWIWLTQILHTTWQVMTFIKHVQQKTRKLRTISFLGFSKQMISKSLTFFVWVISFLDKKEPKKGFCSSATLGFFQFHATILGETSCFFAQKNVHTSRFNSVCKTQRKSLTYWKGSGLIFTHTRTFSPKTPKKNYLQKKCGRPN